MDDLRQAMVPPHNTEAEQSVLGSVLLDNRAFDAVGSLLSEADFYEPVHRAIWAALGSLVMAGKPADVVTVHAAGQGALPLDYLNDLAGCVPSAINAKRYAEIVREASLRRGLMRLGGELVEAAAKRTATVEAVPQLIDGVVTKLLAMMVTSTAHGEPERIDVVLTRLVDQLNDQAEGKSVAIATGLHELDERTSGGGRPGELWVVGARPSMGKSALCLTLAANVAGDGNGVLFLSQEDSLPMLASRAVANKGRINLADLRNPQRARDQDALWGGVMDGVELLRHLPLWVDDQGGLTLMDVRRKVQQAKHRAEREGRPLRLVVVDYLQLMTGDGDNRNQQLGQVANGMKALAKELGVWIVLLSQLSRKADERSGVPQVSDLRDSGDIEGAADTIVLLHREMQRNQKLGPEWKHYAQAHVGKQKNGPTCTVDLHFDGMYQRFSNWDGPPPSRMVGGRTGHASGGLD